MALEIISLTKFERETNHDPNYTAEFLFNQCSIKCEIYTNAKLNFLDRLPERLGNSRFYACDSNFAKLNGNLYLRVESMCSFEVINDREIERELRKIIRGNGFKNLEKLE